jgi:hypothetical protein
MGANDAMAHAFPKAVASCAGKKVDSPLAIARF